MREMLKHATIEELRKLMKTLMTAESKDGSEIDLIYSIEDELRERGEMEWSTEVELEQGFADLMRRFEAHEKNAAAHGTVTQPSWHEQLLQDAAQDRKARNKKRWRMTQVAASFAVFVFLINTITVKVSGFNFFGELFRWTGQAVYTFFGGEPAVEFLLTHGEMQALQDELDQRGIGVKLPKAVIQGYTFSKLEVTFEEPFCATSWFTDFSNGKEFSIMINHILDEVISGRSESNASEPESTFQHGEIIYSVFTNLDRITVIWQDGEYQLVLHGDLTYDEAKAVIESIESDVTK